MAEPSSLSDVRGSFYWIDTDRRAIRLDGVADYLTLSEDSSGAPFAFDPGTDDFGWEFLFLPDSTVGNPTTDKILVHKCNGTTVGGGEDGYQIRFKPSNGNLTIDLNDSSSAPTSCTFSALVTNDVENLIRLELARSGNYVRAYKDGEFVSQQSIASRPSSISNEETLYIGHVSGGSNDYYKGDIIHIKYLGLPNRFWQAEDDLTTVGNSSINRGHRWNKINYWKMKYGWPREVGPDQVCWYFNDDLKSYDDFSALQYELFIQGSSIETYVDVNQNIYYVWSTNPGPGGIEHAAFSMDAKLRGLDGTMRIYQGAKKQQRRLSFIHETEELWVAWMGVFLRSARIRFHLSDWQPLDFYGYLPTAPVVREIKRLGFDPYLDEDTAYETMVEVEEF